MRDPLVVESLLSLRAVGVGSHTAEGFRRARRSHSKRWLELRNLVAVEVQDWKNISSVSGSRKLVEMPAFAEVGRCLKS